VSRDFVKRPTQREQGQARYSCNHPSAHPDRIDRSPRVLRAAMPTLASPPRFARSAAAPNSLRRTSESADITHEIEQGRATPEVFVNACRRIPRLYFPPSLGDPANEALTRRLQALWAHPLVTSVLPFTPLESVPEACSRRTQGSRVVPGRIPDR
jgi:hypothetical protein